MGSEFGAISLWDWWQRWGRKPTKMRNTTPRPHTVAGQGVRTTVNHSFSTKPNHNSTCIYLGVQLLGPILQCIRIFATSECFLSNRVYVIVLTLFSPAPHPSSELI